MASDNGTAGNASTEEVGKGRGGAFTQEQVDAQKAAAKAAFDADEKAYQEAYAEEQAAFKDANQKYLQRSRAGGARHPRPGACTGWHTGADRFVGFRHRGGRHGP